MTKLAHPRGFRSPAVQPVVDRRGSAAGLLLGRVFLGKRICG